MKSIYCVTLRLATIAIAVCFTLISCQMGQTEIKHYRNQPKDPALIGEWLYLGDLAQIKSNPKLIEENLDGVGFLAGVIYHSNGDVQVIRLQYSKKSAEPLLVREPPKQAFYTQDGVIYYIQTQPKKGDYPNRFQEPYIIKGNLLCTDPIDGKWEPQYERKSVTVELFPKRVVE